MLVKPKVDILKLIRNIYISCEYPPEHFWDGNKLDQVETRFSEILEIRGECKRKKPVRRVIDT